MKQIPHDIADLALAPVVLRLEDELEGLRGLDKEDIAFRIALEANRQPRTADQRRRDLLYIITRFVELHGWTCEWTERGLRVQNGLHVVTLGVPDSVRAYLGTD